MLIVLPIWIIMGLLAVYMDGIYDRINGEGTSSYDLFPLILLFVFGPISFVVTLVSLLFSLFRKDNHPLVMIKRLGHKGLFRK